MLSTIYSQRILRELFYHFSDFSNSLLDYVAQANNQVDLEKSIIDLCSQISSVKEEKISAVFRVNFGDNDHSFTIIAQGGSVELLQSFAGSTGESLAKNISKGKPFNTSDFCNLLENIPKGKDERKASSMKLFDGEIMLDKDQNDLWPELPISWNMSSLKTTESIFKLLMTKIKNNLIVIQELLK